MQFLPGTWGVYAADGNGDGVADPHNVFDAALAAGKYLCSGGLDLRDSGQELRAVLRYNNSMAYAGNVLSWSAAYRSGGGPRPVPLAPGVVPPGVSGTVPPSSEMTAATSPVPPVAPEGGPRKPVPPPVQVMITIPGLPPIPCGIFCPPPPPPPVDGCVGYPVPAPMPRVELPGVGFGPLAPAAPAGAAPGPLPGQLPGRADPEAARRPGDAGAAAAAEQSSPADQQAAACIPPGTGTPGHDPGPGAPAHAAPGAPGDEAAPPSNTEPATPEPATPGSAAEPESATEPAPAPAPQPGITLPFGIVIPLPAPPPAPAG
ncbi:hypothetical protein [Nocardia sp. NBC_00508]|uniref:hypothetical protein n=1 Tax=Nocardia sp. NBC_00508 TaxID=2975992 RepID=UPI002E817BE9|nr:hypothetical protein [Nocardia sp. NBC_00508]